MAVIDSYVKTDIQERSWLYELYFVRDKWEVICWEVTLSGDPRAPYDSIDHRWNVAGVVVGYRDGDPNRPIREPFTEETARAEFEKWRR